MHAVYHVANYFMDSKMCNFHVGRPYHGLIVKFLQYIFIKNLARVISSDLCATIYRL